MSFVVKIVLRLCILSEARQQALKPGVLSYTATISTCDESEQWQVALGISANMQQRTLAPNLFCHNATINACDKTEQWQQDFGMSAKVQQKHQQ